MRLIIEDDYKEQDNAREKSLSFVLLHSAKLTMRLQILAPFLVLLALAGSTSTFAQRTCGTDSVHAHMMGIPGYEDAFRDKLDAVEAALAGRGECAEPLVIPVAVHFQNVGVPMACAIDMALDQVETLNQDFAGTNADISTWNTMQPDIWPAISNAESCICFCLASLNHPAGWGLDDGDYAVTLDETAGDSDADWAGYLNFFVRDIGGGILGYSPLGGSGNGDGVVVGPDYFGSVSCGGNSVNPPFNMGRTVTHEVGHYLLLEHPWGGGGCASNDFVDDTPVTDNPVFGCPGVELINCTDPVLWPSYMDYCDDACLFMFSEGQVARMETYVESNLQSFLNNSATVCVEALCQDFEVAVASQDESCDGNDGSIVLTAEGGAEPYNYSINNGGSFVPAGNFSNLSENDYQVMVTDQNGCEFEVIIGLDRDPPSISIADFQNEYCSDASGYIEVDAIGSNDFEYSIDGGNTWQVSPIFNGLSAGLLTVQVANNTGCSGSVQTVLTNDSDLGYDVEEYKTVNCTWFDNGRIDVVAQGSEGSVTYILDGIDESPLGLFEGISSGPHTIYMEDSVGCVTYYNFEMVQSFAELDPDCPCTVFVPNAFTPDGDNKNDVMTVVPSCPIIDFELTVFNRWGEAVFTTNTLEFRWNGGLNGYYVDTGVYAYQMTWRWGNELGAGIDYQTKSGSIMVIR